MNKFFILTISCMILFACESSEEGIQPLDISVSYIETEKGEFEETFFGKNIKDPYRWLENDTSNAVENWVVNQNAGTNMYLGKLQARELIRKRLEELWNYPKYGMPVKEGDYYYYYKNDGLQNQSVFYKTKDLSQDGEVFIDPNKFSADGTSSLKGVYFSKTGKLAVYSKSGAGSDWVNFQIKDVESGEDLEDRLEKIKFSGAAWYKDGFFYSAFPDVNEGTAYSSQNAAQKVYYHKLGNSQDQDRMIYEDKQHPLRYNWANVTDDERYLILSSSEGTSGNSLSIKDLKNGINDPFAPLVKNFTHDHWVIGNVGSKIFIMTNLGAPNYKLVSVDASAPGVNNWVDVLPNDNDKVLKSASLTGGHILANYMQDVKSRVIVYQIDGTFKHEISLPSVGTAYGFNGKWEDEETFYSFTSFTYPSVIYQYDIADNESKIFKSPQLTFDPEDYQTKQLFFKSEDGTQVPIFIVHKKGIKLDGNNPCMLYGYGGFNISILPTFSPSRIVFLEQGGIYASANIRGGGEYGEKWHKAGMLLNKQNVFNDFIGAAEFLIQQGYTDKDKLAISGRSNGGLLVGVAMTQRPDLFKVALPGVGVMDMLRYHKFTVGHGWMVEYGNPDEQEHFENLLSYSPLHNIKDGVNYPATLVTTADHDDRVVPAHSFKFIAELQSKHSGENPVLIRIETKAGHGAGKSTKMIIQEWADVWAFTFNNLDHTYKSKDTKGEM